MPLTLALGGGETVMVISGPNTGGKTVALKTVGLAALSAQSAIPVAARARGSADFRPRAGGYRRRAIDRRRSFDVFGAHAESEIDARRRDRAFADSGRRNGHRHGAGRRRGAGGRAARRISRAARADARHHAPRPAEGVRLDDAGHPERGDGIRRRASAAHLSAARRRAGQVERHRNRAAGWGCRRAWSNTRRPAFRPNRARRAT